MKCIGLAILLTTMAIGSAIADETCHSRAIGKDGGPLAGAALSSFIAKCARDTCEPKAIDKNGRPLAGAAKVSVLKKCENDA